MLHSIPFLLFSSALLAQDVETEMEECSTVVPASDSTVLYSLPWYGNGEWLKNFVPYYQRETVRNERSHFQQGLNGKAYNIPVKTWIYEGDGTEPYSTPLPSDAAEWYINQANAQLEAAGLEVFLYIMPQNIEHLIDGRYYTPNDQQGDDLLESNYIPFYMNVHFVLNSSAFGGRGSFPWDNIHPYAFVTTTQHDTRGDRDPSNTITPIIIHELGHCLGLIHTHSARGGIALASNNGEASKCWQESVSRTKRQGALCVKKGLKCEVNGDFLCSTEADPQLTHSGRPLADNSVNSSCIATNLTEDNWNRTWTPPVNNYMCYATSSCRNEFTWEQLVIARLFVENRLSLTNTANPNYFYINPHIDPFENDNFWQNANDFNMEGLQFHSFHYDPHPAAVSQAETDWVQFRPQPGEEFFVATAPVQGADAPNNMQVRIYRGIDTGTGTITSLSSVVASTSTTDGFSELSLIAAPTGRHGDPVYYAEFHHPSATTDIPPQYVIGIFQHGNMLGSGLVNGGPVAPAGFGVTGTGSLGTLGGGLNGVLCDGDVLTYTIDPNGSMANDPLVFSWTSPASWLTLNPVPGTDGRSVSVNLSGFPSGGQADITLSISDPSGNLLYEVSQTYWFGEPNGVPVLIPSEPSREFCSGHLDPNLGYYTASGGTGTTGYRWFINGQLVHEGPESELTAQRIFTGPNPRAMVFGSNLLSVVAYNPCGESIPVNDTFTVLTNAQCYNSKEAEKEADEPTEPTSTLTFFPNPTEEAIRIVLDERFIGKEMLISVYNAQGQFVNTEISVGQTQAKVGLQNLPAGIYFVELGSQTAYERLKVVKR